MIAFSKEVLKNGLTFIHHYDPNTPFAIVNTLYKVGAKDEQEDRTGFAHLFEHLMFSGSKNFPDFDKPLQAAGAENNAFTNNDYTDYYETVPAVNIEIPLCLEADRMFNLNINSKSLNVQRKVVCEEFKENYINQPYGNVWHLLREMVYEQHHYKWPTIGKSLQHIEDATLQDVRTFYDTFYTPNNAILVIAGNVQKEKASQLVHQYFSELPAKPLQLQKIEEPEQAAAKEKTVYEDVPLNAIFIAFKIHDRLHRDHYISDVTSDILSNGTSSRLHERLVKSAKAFVEIDAYTSASNEVGMFTIEGKITDGYAVEKAVELIWAELDLLKTELVSEHELKKCKNKMLTYMNFSEASLMNRAISLAYYELLGDANLINEEEHKYEQITAADIQQFAIQTFQKEKSNTLYYLKKNN